MKPVARSRYNVSLPPDLAAFWKRKKLEIYRSQELEAVEELKDTDVFEALVAFWRAEEKRIAELWHKTNGQPDQESKEVRGPPEKRRQVKPRGPRTRR